MILESIQSWAGVRLPPSGYLQAVRKLCDETGALMIIDENESGFGRTGTMFAIEALAPTVVPDIMTLGKSLSGGLYPIAAALYRPEYLKFWEKYPYSHLSTFAGSDLGCVVGLETIRYLEREKMGARALDVSSADVEKILDAFSRALAGCQSILTPMKRETLESLLHS